MTMVERASWEKILNESLRTFDLPKLDEESTALEFGDWLSMVDSYMGDVS